MSWSRATVFAAATLLALVGCSSKSSHSKSRPTGGAGGLAGGAGFSGASGSAGTAGNAGTGGGATDGGSSDAPVSGEDPCPGLQQAPPASGGWPDSKTQFCLDFLGQTGAPCGTVGSMPGQDGEYAHPTPAYDANPCDGRILFDPMTGLEWDNSPTLQKSTWLDAPSACQDLKLGGGGWRVPSQAELLSLADFGQASALLPAEVMDHSGNTWSAGEDLKILTNAWVVFFDDGTSEPRGKNSKQHLRCVRGGAPTTMMDNGDGTVSDPRTNLSWKQADEGVHPWAEALDVCEQLDFAGAKDWRLPNVKELATLVDRKTTSPVIDTNLFPNAQSARHWSATAYPDDVSHPATAYFLNFSNGRVFRGHAITQYRVRCVR